MVLFSFDPFIRGSPVDSNSEFVQDVGGVLNQPRDDMMSHGNLGIETALQCQ